MMLDNKSEEKQPLTVVAKRCSVKGYFFLFLSA